MPGGARVYVSVCEGERGEGTKVQPEEVRSGGTPPDPVEDRRLVSLWSEV